jgi:hypothetical protein
MILVIGFTMFVFAIGAILICEGINSMIKGDEDEN